MGELLKTTRSSGDSEERTYADGAWENGTTRDLSGIGRHGERENREKFAGYL